MTGAVTGFTVVEWLVAAAAGATAVGVLWRKVVRPSRDFVRRFKEWMNDVHETIVAVKAQLEPNGGSTLLDKVTANAESIRQMDRNVRMLLQHDAERDREGLRYADKTDRQEPQGGSHP